MEKGIGWMDKDTDQEESCWRKKKELPDTKPFTIQDQILTEKMEALNLKIFLPIFLEGFQNSTVCLRSNINQKKAAKHILNNPKMQENIELCND